MNGVCYRLIGETVQSAIKGGQLKESVLRKVGLSETFEDCMSFKDFAQQGTAAGVVIYPKPTDWDEAPPR